MKKRRANTVFDFAGSGDQYAEWMKLQRAIDASPEVPPCTNYPDAFWPVAGQSASGTEQRWAIAACQSCPVIEECRTYAIQHEDEGIWGGTFGRQRVRLRAVLRREGVLERRRRPKTLREAS